jgi:hypothetical protein
MPTTYFQKSDQNVHKSHSSVFDSEKGIAHRGNSSAPGGLTRKQISLRKKLETPNSAQTILRRYWRRAKRRYEAVKSGFFAALAALLVESHNNQLTVLVQLIEFLQTLAFNFSHVQWGPYGDALGKVLLATQVRFQSGGMICLVELTNWLSFFSTD